MITLKDFGAFSYYCVAMICEGKQVLAAGRAGRIWYTEADNTINCWGLSAPADLEAVYEGVGMAVFEFNGLVITVHREYRPEDFDGIQEIVRNGGRIEKK
jgi:hypothetical protein